MIAEMKTKKKKREQEQELRLRDKILAEQILFVQKIDVLMGSMASDSQVKLIHQRSPAAQWVWAQYLLA